MVIYVDPECLKSISRNKEHELLEQKADGSYVWPFDPMAVEMLQTAIALRNWEVIFLHPNASRLSNEIPMAWIDKVHCIPNMEMVKLPMDQYVILDTETNYNSLQLTRVVQCNIQYGFTRRELEAVIAKAEGTETESVDLSDMVEKRVSMIKITEAKLRSVLETHHDEDTDDLIIAIAEAGL